MTFSYSPWPTSRFRIPNIQPGIQFDAADYASFLFDGGESGTEEYIARMIRQGVYTQEQINEIPPSSAKNDTPAKTVPPASTTCDGSDNLKDYPDDLQLSTYFNLGQLSNKSALPQTRVIAQRGLTKGQIVCNLKLLAVNALDPIKKKYPDMYVSNAFRLPEGASAGRSQHEIGQAADIQFNSANKDKKLYYDIVLWIKDNVPYDQLLLEYKTTGTRLPWIHITFNSNGNRPPSDKSKNMTFLNHTPYKPSPYGYSQLA
jgi:hypothetical protein